MISPFTLNLILKLITLGHKINALPWYYDRALCRLRNVEGKARYKWLLCFSVTHLYGNIQVLIVLWRAFVDDYPVSLLLQEFVVPIGFGLYTLFAVQFLVYEREMKILLNQMMDINSKLRRLFWISSKERDGLELFICSYFYNTISIVLLRFPQLFFFDKFNNMYAYYVYEMGPNSGNFFLRSAFYIWDWFSTVQFVLSSTTSAVIFFIFVNTNKIWCKKMMYSLMFIEFQSKALREQIINKYRSIQLNHRLFTFVFLKRVFPMALAACTMDLILFIFILLKFFNKLGFLTLVMIITVIVTIIVAVWVILYSSFKMTECSHDFLRIYRSQKSWSKVGKVVYRSLEPLFVRIGFAYTATESTVLTLFRIVLESVVNLLIAVD